MVDLNIKGDSLVNSKMEIKVNHIKITYVGDWIEKLSDFFSTWDDSKEMEKFNGEFYKYLKYSIMDLNLTNTLIVIQEDLTDLDSN
jgi:hypothetical protein